MLVKIAASAVFLGRAWQFIIWDAPFRAFFWDESLMKGLVKFFGFSWSYYLENVATDKIIGNTIIACGIVLLFCALGVWILPRIKKMIKLLIIVGVFILLFLTFLLWKEHFFLFAQLIEYTLQWSTPLFLLYFFGKKEFSDRSIFLLKLAIALTFVGHGLYALGVYPIPGNFMVFVVRILGVSNEGAVQFLFWAGVLDMIVGIGVFLPWKWSKWIILYAVAWGLATTAARIWAHFFWEDIGFVFWRWMPETLFRFPHFIVPTCLWMILWLRAPLKKVEPGLQIHPPA